MSGMPRAFVSLGQPNSKVTIVMENGPGLKMYFLLKMGIIQPAKSNVARS